LHDNKHRCCDKLQENFNPQMYAGAWYQIADIPQYYERGCGFESAVYTLLPDKIKVTNTCYDSKGNVIATAVGSAVAPDHFYPASLRVSFPRSLTNVSPMASKRPTDMNVPGPNYLVHWTDYNTAMVGSPTRNSIFLLSRHPKICPEKYKKFLRYAAEYGYDVNKIVVNPNAIMQK
jgi:apolipoprotein D and lipocalin family protein